MDTWIHGYPFSLDTWILGYFGYQIFSLSRFWISYPSIRIFLDTFFKLQEVEKGNQIQVLRLLACPESTLWPVQVVYVYEVKLVFFTS